MQKKADIFFKKLIRKKGNGLQKALLKYKSNNKSFKIKDLNIYNVLASISSFKRY